jgi:hypothetical protein
LGRDMPEIGVTASRDRAERVTSVTVTELTYSNKY